MHAFGRLTTFASAWLLILCAGCGTERYEQRLLETRKLLDYQNKLDDNLGRPWSDFGIELRLPKQFSLVPAPPVETNENGEPIPSGPDPRQPNYMTTELPGLLAAFQATVEADVNGEFKPVPAYAYVLGNHEYWLRSDIDQATAFHQTLTQEIVSGLGLPTPDTATSWQPEKYPQSGGYVPRKDATVWREKTSRYVDETNAQVSLHLFQSQDVLLAVLFVYPLTIDPNEQLPERIQMSLETLSFSGERPTGSGSGSAGSPASQPAAGF
jgi:hypothetical protein